LGEPKLSKICDFACGSGTLLTAAYCAANKQYRFSLLKNGLDKNPLEIGKDFTVKEAYIIAHEIIKKYARFSKRLNGYLLNLKGKILEDPKVENVTQLLIKNQLTLG
jgi:type I restriction-modification system DNA methylase subunit